MDGQVCQVKNLAPQGRNPLFWNRFIQEPEIEEDKFQKRFDDNMLLMSLIKGILKLHC